MNSIKTAFKLALKKSKSNDKKPSAQPGPSVGQPTMGQTGGEHVGRTEHDKTGTAIPKLYRPPLVVGGDILRTPVDKTAALVVSRCPWWAQPPPDIKPEPPPPPPPKHRKRHQISKLKKLMSKGFRLSTSQPEMAGNDRFPNQDYVSVEGIHVKMVNGQPMFPVEEVDRLIIEQIQKLSKETAQHPMVADAKAARLVIDELIHGLGGDFEKFKVSTKMWLEDIRMTRFAVVSETAQMTGPLKDVRQFFLGSDYKEQIERLREFVNLCERLKALKDSGFLDTIADTMLRLSIGQPNNPMSDAK